jgi:hypothetical protein
MKELPMPLSLKGNLLEATNSLQIETYGGNQVVYPGNPIKGTPFFIRQK